MGIKKNMKIVSFSCDGEDYEKLRDHAYRDRKTISRIVQEVVKEYLRSESEKEKNG